MKRLMYAAACAAMALTFSSQARAVQLITFNQTPPVQFSNIAPDGSFSGTFTSNNIPLGAFSDTYNFTFPSNGLAASTISTIFSTNQNNNVSFTSVTLDGVAFNIASTGLIEFRYLDNLPVTSGLQTLIVNGFSGGNASYAGTLAFTPAVPEPATWAMMVLGFGMIGFVVRKRKSITNMRLAAIPSAG